MSIYGELQTALSVNQRLPIRNLHFGKFHLPTPTCSIIICLFSLILTFNFDCFSQLHDCVFTAIGVGSGIATSIIPFMILLVVWLCTRTCLVKKKLIRDMYEASERERAMTHLITHLLTVSTNHGVQPISP